VTKFQGFFQLLQNRYQFQRFDGGTLTVTREVFERGCAVGVLPYDPVTDMVVLVEQFRPGAIYFGRSPWLIELIAGMVEEGETPQEVAKREALEEAGCELQNFKQIAHYLVSPGGSTEAVTAYVAVCDSTKVARYAGLTDEQEDIKVHVMHRVELMRRLDEGELSNGLTLIAAQWLQHNYVKWKEAGF